LCEIPDEFITDHFNQTGLPDICHRFAQCCDIMVGKFDATQILPIARELEEQLPIAYGLLHARFIMSPDGLNGVREKYIEMVYGTCPRINCQDEPLLPIGLSSNLSTRAQPNPVRVFCPCCREVYNARPAQTLDGAFFGPNMCHIFIDDMNLASHRKRYVPYAHVAFGFRVRDERR
jgi:casein kinase II subunit beta